MDATQIAAASVMAVALIGATYTDIRYAKIFNYLTVPTALVGIVINGLGHGTAGILSSLAGAGLGLALLPVCGLLGRIIGGGDIKLLAAVGALVGPQTLMWVFFYTAVAGGVLALAVALWRRCLLDGMRRLVGALCLRFAADTPVDLETVDHRARLPYAIAITLGSFMAVYAVYLR